MTTKDAWALLVLVLFLLSTLIWGGSWVNFVAKARTKQTVNSRAIKRTSIRIGIGAALSGGLLVIMGLMLQTPPSGGIPALGYVYLFTVCPGIFVLVVLAGFLRTAIEIRRKDEATATPNNEQNLVD